LSSFGRRFDPAQPDVHPELRALLLEAARLEPEHGPAIIARVASDLRALFRTAQPVVVHQGPATALREIGLRSTVEHRALALIAGPEGEALADQTEALGKEVLRVRVQAGRVVEPAHLQRFLAGPEVDAVTLVHVLLFVDAGGSLGASPLDMDVWGVDFVVAASEGPLGLPGGLAFAAASPRLLARARSFTGRGSQLDFVAQHAAAGEGRTLAPVTPMLAAVLERQLQRVLHEEGLEARWNRHAVMRAMVEAWAIGRSELRLLAGGRQGAQAASALALSGAGRTAAAVGSLLEQEGWRIGLGQVGGGGEAIRIGHMGDLAPDQLAALLEALGRALTPP
jgi:aspartate aminotransferase-like enzyme